MLHIHREEKTWSDEHGKRRVHAWNASRSLSSSGFVAGYSGSAKSPRDGAPAIADMTRQRAATLQASRVITPRRRDRPSVGATCIVLPCVTAIPLAILDA